jgi:putative hydrolase of the HAD superfamily
MIRAVLFDLDDTLYAEAEYFRSGFARVASILEQRAFGTAVEIASTLETYHHECRARVFDRIAAALGFPSAWVVELVAAFREHDPNISLAPDVVPVLQRLRGRYKLGCITDGWADVQRRKLAALGAERYVDTVVVTDDYGRDKWKPSPFPFLECCRQLGVHPGEAIYVGDNPERDVRGARNARIRCVRIRRDGGYFRDTVVADISADYEIGTLRELEAVLSITPQLSSEGS